MTKKQVGILTPSDIAANRRRERIRELMLQGITSQNKIAVALGVSQGLICQDMKQVLEHWVEGNKLGYDKRWARRIEQYAQAATAAWNSYEVSKKNAVETSTVSTPRKCKECEGTGFRPNTNSWCKACKGEGELMTEIVTKRVKGQAGDSSFLAEYRKNVDSMVKMEGLYEIMCSKIKKNELREQPPVQQITINSQQNQYIDVRRMSPELLLEARGLIAKMRPLMKDQGIIEQEE